MEVTFYVMCKFLLLELSYNRTELIRRNAYTVLVQILEDPRWKG
jgi:hypothetical protein